MTPPVPSRPAAIVNGILTSGLARACYYAASRPDCQVLASVRYGPVALCAPCDQQRSTLGKGTAPTALPDPRALLEIAAAGDACQQAAAALRHAVAAARQAGHPWSAVAAILGGTRQAAHQRFAHSPDTTPAAARKRAGR
jgi:hypothetical protein